MMLNHLADLIRLRPLGLDAVERVSPAGAADLNHLPVGTELQARVTAASPNRMYQVLIGDRAYTLHLPIDASPGDELRLTVVQRDLQRAPSPLPQPATAAGGAAMTTLSTTARFITALLNTPAQPPPAGGPGPVARPLLPAPPEDTAAVATRLRQALGASGMFYESHQAQWIAGERSLAQLMQEPQARLQPLPPADAPAPVASAADSAAAPGPGAGAARAVEAPVHPSLLAVVKEQLQTLSTLELAWHGQVWPGQDMRWEIAEEPSGQSAAPDAPGAWQTRLRLKLPRLGDVNATLTVGAAGVGIALATGTAATADTLAAHGAALRAALTAAGLRPAHLRIERAAAGHE